MFPFYTNMKSEIINFFSINNRPELLYTEIIDLPAYKNAPSKYQEDFNGSILSGLSRSVSKPKTLSKSMNSTFSNFFKDENEVPALLPINTQMNVQNSIDSLIA